MSFTALIVEDEKGWQESFSQALPAELISDITLADSAIRAADALRKRRFDIVILDLCMDEKNSADRSNEKIQQYLATEPEQTQYIIASYLVNRSEVRDAMERLGAAGVVFKDEIAANRLLLAERIGQILEKQKGSDQKRIVQTVRQLFGDIHNESRLFQALGIGAADLYVLGERLIRPIGTLSRHRSRTVLEAQANVAFGIAWSRGLGFPIAISLSKSTVTEEDQRGQLVAWLGFSPGEVLTDFMFAGKVKATVYRLDPSMETSFDLPHVPA
jgi:DNA-binding NarL/FixJ family response regulator